MIFAVSWFCEEFIFAEREEMVASLCLTGEFLFLVSSSGSGKRDPWPGPIVVSGIETPVLNYSSIYNSIFYFKFCQVDETT